MEKKIFIYRRDNKQLEIVADTTIKHFNSREYLGVELDQTTATTTLDAIGVDYSNWDTETWLEINQD